METLFENSHIRNKQVAKEIYRYFFFQRAWNVVIFSMLIFMFLFGIVFYILTGISNWPIFIMVPVFFLYRLYCYFYYARMMIKRDMEMHGKEIEVKSIVTEEFIQNTASHGGVVQMEYDKIRKGVQTKNLILLRTKTGMFWIFRKDGFTKGTKDEFIMFLRNKGIRIK